jgi:hypothetical protein
MVSRRDIDRRIYPSYLVASALFGGYCGCGFCWTDVSDLSQDRCKQKSVVEARASLPAGRQGCRFGLWVRPKDYFQILRGASAHGLFHYEGLRKCRSFSELRAS